MKRKRHGIVNRNIYIDFLLFVRFSLFSSNPLEVFVGKGILKIRNKFTGEHPCGKLIAIELLCMELNFAMGVLL